MSSEGQIMTFSCGTCSFLDIFKNVMVQTHVDVCGCVGCTERGMWIRAKEFWGKSFWSFVHYIVFLKKNVFPKLLLSGMPWCQYALIPSPTNCCLVFGGGGIVHFSFPYCRHLVDVYENPGRIRVKRENEIGNLEVLAGASKQLGYHPVKVGMCAQDGSCNIVRSFESCWYISK